MTTINGYFDKVFCINLARRPDRWKQVEEECRLHNLELERFEAIDAAERFAAGNQWYGIPWDGKDVPDGNCGCTESHGALLKIIAEGPWKRVLVLEDDFHFRFPDSQKKFSDMIGEVPEDWDLFYLGGHYAEPPIARVSKHVIRCGAMMTTSSYGVTPAMAAAMEPSIHGHGPVDALFFDWCRNRKALILQPRLIVQRESFSDLQNRMMDNTPCMEDPNHEKMV
jgi:GR25 family glycosyltransferase involved in LPS biosynthesis